MTGARSASLRRRSADSAGASSTQAPTSILTQPLPGGSGGGVAAVRRQADRAAIIATEHAMTRSAAATGEVVRFIIHLEYPVPPRRRSVSPAITEAEKDLAVPPGPVGGDDLADHACEISRPGVKRWPMQSRVRRFMAVLAIAGAPILPVLGPASRAAEVDRQPARRLRLGIVDLSGPIPDDLESPEGKTRWDLTTLRGTETIVRSLYDGPEGAILAIVQGAND